MTKRSHIWMIAPLVWVAPFSGHAEPESTASSPRVFRGVNRSVQGLLLTEGPLNVVEEKDGFFRVILEGSYVRENWTLLLQQKPIRLEKSGKFQAALLIRGAKSRALVTAISPMGTIEEEVVEISFPGWKSPEKQPKSSKTEGLGLTAGLSYSRIFYQQTSVVSISESALTGKLAYVRNLSPVWNIGVSGFATLLPFGQSSTDPPIKFLGLNFRVGYQFPQVSRPWTLSLMAGGYYNAGMGSGADFGYSIYGAQIFPVVRRSLNGGRAINVYAKISPLRSSSSLVSFSNRELAFGIGWEVRRVSVTLDLSSLNATSESGGAVSVTAISLGAGFGF